MFGCLFTLINIHLDRWQLTLSFVIFNFTTHCLRLFFQKSCIFVTATFGPVCILCLIHLCNFISGCLFNELPFLFFSISARLREYAKRNLVKWQTRMMIRHISHGRHYWWRWGNLKCHWWLSLWSWYCICKSKGTMKLNGSSMRCRTQLCFYRTFQTICFSIFTNLIYRSRMIENLKSLRPVHIISEDVALIHQYWLSQWLESHGFFLNPAS